jgi:hypothetical protein
MGRRRWGISASRRLPIGDAISASAVGAHAQSPRAPSLRRSTARPTIISNAERGFAQTRVPSDKIKSHLHHHHARAEIPRRVTRRGPCLRGHPRFSYCRRPSLPRVRRQASMAGAGSAVTPSKRFDGPKTRCRLINRYAPRMNRLNNFWCAPVGLRIFGQTPKS